MPLTRAGQHHLDPRKPEAGFDQPPHPPGRPVSSAPPPSVDQIGDGSIAADPAVADPSGPTLTRDDVAHLAHLARLQLSEQELDIYVGQLSVILDAVTTVSAVAAADADIEPTTHAVPLTNVYREDVVRPGLSHEAALAGAPAVEDDRFRVPQILGEEQ
jgi:aspartyl-tRNA(Asn)/glutamyl-tRNA(Gln) amidotransferase subunit C